MNVSHASVHPIEEVATTEGGADQNVNVNAPRVRMKDIQGMPGTVGGLSLRVSQFVFAAAALSIMTSTSDFPSVTAFCYLVAAAGLHTLWSLSLAITDVYALLVRRSLQNYQIVSLFTIGDGVTSTLTFAAACASAGITVLIDNDLGSCAQNHCVQFETATGMAFICWFTTVPSFLLNFWSLASR
ncbi:CASP-like protein 5A2 isoform X2 [Abrus precatorius]|uniref:CASP-like protein n=1 Tax=Abrus precatorius TaxID=3816 RepID=A0A8B8KSF1_ABRPR|nr:CASP-like protein 5A2 isoform X2 [Abrus precatorius]XP_027346781.1 CASP-like protein 5A2 isoform X2 [Abrus precatorius]